MPLRALVLTAGLYAVAALAQEVPPPAYQLAAQRAGIPSTVLYAVALQESGIRRNGRLVPWPWSLVSHHSATILGRFSIHFRAISGRLYANFGATLGQF